MTAYRSPNFDSRDGHAIDMLVLHYTGMPAACMALERLCDPSARVSAHYTVEEDGTVHAMVDEQMRAWHAGVASWRGASNINQRSIGIEIVNPGHEFGYRPFPSAQMEAVVALCRGILARHPAISPRNVTGHSDVAPARKLDPGELFDWKMLAGQGIGLWPSHSSSFSRLTRESQEIIGSSPMMTKERGDIEVKQGEESAAVRAMQQSLADYGYGVQVDGVFDAVTEAVVTAFQRHFRQNTVDGVWDAECAALLAALHAIC